MAEIQPGPWTAKDWSADLNLVVRYRSIGINLEFEAYQCNGSDAKGPCLVTRDESRVDIVDSDEIDEAIAFCRGFIRFDGCANFMFPLDADVMLHTCGRSQAVAIGTMFDRLYSILAELQPEHAGMLR